MLWILSHDIPTTKMHAHFVAITPTSVQGSEPFDHMILYLMKVELYLATLSRI